MITRPMMERVVVEAAVSEGITDLHPDELEFYFDGMVTSVALKSVNLVLDGQDECLMLKSICGQLDFEELPRYELLVHLEDCSGLPTRACAKMLDAINLLVSDHLQRLGRVKIEHLGEMVRKDSGYHLVLEERLQTHRQ